MKRPKGKGIFNFTPSLTLFRLLAIILTLQLAFPGTFVSELKAQENLIESSNDDIKGEQKALKKIEKARRQQIDEVDAVTLPFREVTE